MTTAELYAYRGVYQAYAWMQGWADAPIDICVPDENFYVGSDDFDSGFDLVKFFEVADDMDSEGAIHYWKMRVEGFNTILTLACTEDSSMTFMTDATLREYHTTADMYETLKARVS